MQRALFAKYGILLGLFDFNDALARAVPIAGIGAFIVCTVSRIGPHNQEIAACLDETVTGAGGQHHYVAGANFQLHTLYTTALITALPLATPNTSCTCE